MTQAETQKSEDDTPATAAMAMKWRWLIVALIAVAMFFSGRFGSLEGLNAATVSGAAFGSTLVVYLIVYFALLRKRGALIGVSAFLLIFIATLIGKLEALDQEKAQALKGAAIMEKQLNALKTATDATGKIDFRPEQAPELTGDQAQLQAFLRDYWGTIVASQNEYVAALAASGWNGILDPARLSKDAQLTESRAIIGKAKALVDKYRAQTIALIESAPAKIDKLDATSDFKRGMLVGYNRGLENTRASIGRHWDLEAMILKEIEHEIDLLDRRRGNWSVKNGKIVFNSNQDLQAYRSYLAKVDEYAAEQDKLQKERLAGAQQKLNEFKEALK